MKGYYTILFLLLTVGVFAQNKRLQQKANDLYKNEQYAEAIPLYEELLAEDTTLSVQTKLAYCYRVNNNLAAAESLYGDIVQHDKAKAITWFYYAETLMGNGKYAEAKQWLEQYQKAKPEDERADLLIRACEEVPNIQPYFPYVYLREFPYNSAADDNSAVVFNGQIVFSSDRKQGVKLLKQKSGWTGRDYLKLYASYLSEDWSKMTEAETYSTRLTELNKNTGNATFTADGTEVYFTKNNNEVSKRNAYNLQIFRAVSDGDEKWREVEKLTFCSAEYNYMHPAISPDGKYLFFVSDKPRGEGGTDIYWTKRRDDGIWGKVQNLGTIINTPSHEGFPFFTQKGELFFCSKGHIGYGGFDIFTSQLQTDGSWSTPTNLGKPINSSLDDISIYLNKNQTRGLFTSARANGDDDIYLFEVGRMPVAPQARMLANENPLDSVAAPRINNEQLIADLQQPASYDLAEKGTAQTEEISLSNTTTNEILAVDSSIITNINTPTEAMVESMAASTPSAADIGSLDEIAATDSTNIKQTAATPIEEETSEMASPPVTVTEEERVLAQVDSAVQTTIVTRPQLEEIPTENITETIADTMANQPRAEDKVTTPHSVPAKSPDTPLQQLSQQLNNQNYNFKQNITLTEIAYAPTAIEPADYQTLDRLVAFLQKFPQVEIELSAHTVSDKEETPRKMLTEKRAYTAAAYLVERGIATRRIVPRGYGSSRLGEDVLSIKILAF